MKRAATIVGCLVVLAVAVFAGVTIHRLQSRVDHLAALQASAAVAQSGDHDQTDQNKDDIASAVVDISSLQDDLRRLDRSTGGSSPYGLSSQLSNVEQVLTQMCNQLSIGTFDHPAPLTGYFCRLSY